MQLTPLEGLVAGGDAANRQLECLASERALPASRRSAYANSRIHHSADGCEERERKQLKGAIEMSSTT